MIYITIVELSFSENHMGNFLSMLMVSTLISLFNLVPSS